MNFEIPICIEFVHNLKNSKYSRNTFKMILFG